MLPEEREDVELTSSAAGRPASADDATGAKALIEEPAPLGGDDALTHATGVEVKARSQWAYARMRFLRHRLAVASLVVLIIIGLVALFAERVAPYGYDEIPLDDLINSLNKPPTTEDHHYFGTDQLGRDYFSRVIYGVRTSFWVALVVAGLSTLIGTALGGVAGYYGGWVDNVLMRFTDLILTLPGLAVLLTAAQFFGQGDVDVTLGRSTRRSRSRSSSA